MEPGWARLGGRAAGGRGSGREGEGQGKEKKRRKAYSTRYSQAVSHPSTNQARPCLASEIRRDRARSGWYGRRRLWLPLGAPRACSAPPSPSPSPSPAPAERLSALLAWPGPGACLPACLPASQHAQGTRCLRHPGAAEVRALSRPGTLLPRRRLAPGMATGWVGAPGARPEVFSERPPTPPPPAGSTTRPLAFPPLPAAGLKAHRKPRAPPQTIITIPTPWPFLRHPSPPHPATPGPDRETPGAGSQYAHTQTHRERQRDTEWGDT